MFFKEILTAMALVASGLTAHQDAAMDLQVAAPEISAQVSEVRNPISVNVRGPQDSRRVSGDFKNVSLQEVLDWLQGEDVSFVVGDDVKSERRVSLHISNQPLNSTIDAVLEGFGLHAERRGDVIVVKPGAGSPFNFHMFNTIPKAPSAPGAPQIRIEEFTNSMKDLGDLPKIMELHELGGKEFDGEKFARDFEKQFDEKKFAEQFGQSFDAEKFAKQFRMNFDEKKFAKGFDAEKFARDLSKSFDEKAFAEQFKNLKNLKDLEKNEIRVEIDAQKAEARAKQAEKLSKDIALKIGKGTWVDTEQLLKSLTPAQKSLQAKRGYLTPSDLTASQRALLHGMDSGKFTINISTNSGKLVLKNK
jgi:Secretin and TonB N terminus short domain